MSRMLITQCQKCCAGVATYDSVFGRSGKRLFSTNISEYKQEGNRDYPERPRENLKKYLISQLLKHAYPLPNTRANSKPCTFPIMYLTGPFVFDPSSNPTNPAKTTRGFHHPRELVLLQRPLKLSNDGHQRLSDRTIYGRRYHIGYNAGVQRLKTACGPSSQIRRDDIACVYAL